MEKTVSPRSRALNWIRDAIRDGTLAPGDAVPTVDELALDGADAPISAILRNTGGPTLSFIW